jgi:hypothetical protein
MKPGATTAVLQTEAGRTPVQRNTFYEPIKVWDGALTPSEAELPPGKAKVLEDNLTTA